MRFASWSDAASNPPLINNYIDNTLGAAVQAANGITMRRIPLAATSDAVFSVTSAARLGTAGDIDLIWINGKNFKARATRAAPRRMCQRCSVPATCPGPPRGGCARVCARCGTSG